MSTKTTFKRIALVTVASMGLGLLSSVSAGAVEGTPTATVSPVRVSFTGTTLDVVPDATFSFTNIAAEIADGTNTTMAIAVTQAPTSNATVSINFHSTPNATTDTVGGAATAATAGDGVLDAAITSGATATGTIKISANAAAGTYKGTLTIGDSVDTATVSWSFTTTGAPKSISTDLASIGLPAVDDASSAFVASQSLVVSLLDANSALTQPSTGDSIVASLADYTNISYAWNGTSAVTISSSDLADGKHTLTVGSRSAVADSEVVTLTPAGVLPGAGVVAKTLTATTVDYGTETGLKTVATAPTAASVIAAGTASGSENAYNVDPSNTSYGFEVSGYTVGKAYKIQVLWTDADNSAVGTATVKDDTGNTTASSLTSGTAKVLYGLVGASGKVGITVVSTANNNASDTIKINPLSATADGYTGAEDAIVTNTSAAYAVTLSAPVVTPTLAKTSAAIVVTGKVADTYKSPVQGATVSAVGTVTTTDATPANLTGTATSAADGSFTITLPAATALTTSVSIVVSATKTGIASITQTSAYVVNFNASGDPSALTFTTSTGNEGTATVATTYPAIHVMYEGVTAANAADITDETYTIATGLDSTLGDGLDFCTAITPTTTPAAQVTFAKVAGIKYSTTCTSVAYASLTDTLTVASGSAAYVFATTAGDHVVSFSSGTVTKTAHVWGVANNAGARNISTSAATLALDGGELGYVTLAVKDAFGNLMKSATVNVVVTSTGAAMLDGPSLSKTYTATDASGNIIVGVIAGGKAGTGTITVKATGNQFASLAGTIDPAATVAGTNGLTASTNTATVAVTVSGGAASLVVLINSLIKKINALATLVAKIQKKLGVK